MWIPVSRSALLRETPVTVWTRGLRIRQMAKSIARQTRVINTLLDLDQRLYSRTSNNGFHTNEPDRQVTTESVRNTTLKLSYVHGISSAPLIGATIGQLLEQRTSTYPNREAFVSVHQNVRLTFEQLLLKCDALAAGLLALGVERGDRVGIWAPNCIEWILTQYATARAGIILVNINPAYQVSELEFALRKVGIKMLIMSENFKTQNYHEMLAKVCPEICKTKDGSEIESKRLPDLKRVVMIGQSHFDGVLRFDDLTQIGTRKDINHIHDLQYKLHCDEPINIQFTSGTTGFPKGATLTHHNIVNNARFMGFRMAYDQKPARICLPVPMYHCFGMVLGSLQTIMHNALVVLASAGFDAKSALKAVHDERCTSLYGTPTMFIDMLSLPNFDEYDLKSLQTGIMAGSVCPVELMKEVIERMHMDECTICFGTTENSPVTFQTFPHDNLEKKVSTIGKVMSNTEAKVINEAGQVVPIGETGEICIRGYTVMRGYWDDDEQTKNVISEDGWYRTGDLGFIDEESYGHIVGRKKDMIIRGGENIYPAEIEQFLHKHPKILDAQVIGVPDKRLGEQIAAWIRVRENETLTAEEVKDFCKGQIAHFKVPHYVSFVNEYPLTITGKVQKYKMRDMAVKMYKL